MTTIRKEKPQQTKQVTLRDELLAQIPLLLVGTAPLIVHAWSEKAIGQMRSKQMKEAKGVREAKVPEEDFQAAKYISADGWEGVPAHGLKGSFVEGSRFISGSKAFNMTLLKGALRVLADCPRTNLLRLYSPAPPTMREDLVRVGLGIGKTTDLRYRPEYWPWFLRVVVQFPAALFSPDQVADLIRAAGAFNGFCEWRPGSPQSHTGTYGTFAIGNDDDVARFTKQFGVAV